MPETEVDILEKIDALASSIVEARQKPLFVSYYPEDGGIETLDISNIYDELKRGFGGLRVNDMDILLHTYGGDPDSAYRIIQLVRAFTNSVSILVPFHAYSSGTLMCLGANKIHLGAYAALSPIDIYLVLEDNKIELIAVDKYIEFVKHCKEILENGTELTTNVEEALLVELVKQIGAINIGSFFRERELTKYYAEILLSDYMLKEVPDRQEIIKHIVNMMVFKFPSHEFEVDYNIAKKIGLLVEEMPIDLSEQTKSLIKLLEEATRAERICRYVGNDYRLPYFRLYTLDEGGQHEQ